MADEITTQFTLPDPPDAVRNQWKASPPEFLQKSKFELVDESFNGLVYEADETSAFMRITMFGMGKTLYRLSFVFLEDGTGTKVSVTGQADEKVAAGIAEFAGGHGGPGGTIT
jgi:hypothetical protein